MIVRLEPITASVVAKIWRTIKTRTLKRRNLDFESVVWTVPAEIGKTGRPNITSVGKQLFKRAALAPVTVTVETPPVCLGLVW